MSTLINDEKADSYHHGDLRNTLLALGTEMLAESGVAALSLRKLAQRAGVSHNAPYQHFPDKESLLAAIAEQGFRLLGDAMDSAQADPTHSDPIERLIATGQSYVVFALNHPAHYQLMFGPLNNEAYPDLRATSHDTLAKLVHLVATLQASGHLRPAPPRDVATAIWSLVHGLSAILIANKLPDYIRTQRDDDALSTEMLRHLLAGLRA